MLAVMAVTDDALLAALRGPDRDAAVAELHALLLRAARFELGRRRVADDDLAMEAADDALMAVLGKLDQFRGASRFTTWAYKFALLEAGVKARRRAWRGREVQIDEERWPELPDGGLQQRELVRPGREAAFSAIGLQLAHDRHQCVVRRLRREIIEFTRPGAAPAGNLKARSAQKKGV